LDESKVGIACLYCDYNDQKEQTSVNMIGSLVKQLVRARPNVPDEIYQTFLKSKKARKGLELAEACKMLALCLQFFSRAYICIDALDECDHEHRREFLRSLNQVLQDSTSTHLFLTGRPHIESDVNDCLAIKYPDPVQIKPTEEDIKKYIAHRINDGLNPGTMDKSLRQEIETTITAMSKGM
jgi:hypothetical protein